MAGCILILLWVADEINVNRFHKNLENIYLLSTHFTSTSEKERLEYSPPALGTALKDELPEIHNMARMSSWQSLLLINCNGNSYTDRVRFADMSVFRIFSFPVIKGGISGNGNRTDIILLSESMSQKYFGNEDPVGKTLTLDKKFEMKVTGVFKDIPGNSSIKFEIVVPLEFLNKFWNPQYTSSWTNGSFFTYLQLREGVSSGEFDVKISHRIKDALPESHYEAFTFPFSDLYMKFYGHEKGVRIFSAIAVVILIIACINFMNLSAVRSVNRAREVGLRKVAGAHRKQIFKQFLGESAVLVIIAFCFSLLFAAVLMPFFRDIAGKTITLQVIYNWKVLFGLLTILLVTAAVSGSYPALFLSSFRPVKVLYGNIHSGMKGAFFRKVLVICQFSFAVVLIIMTAAIYSQFKFMKDKDPGYNRDNLLYLPIQGQMEKNYETVKKRLIEYPGIKGVSVVSQTLSGVYHRDANWTWPGKNNNIDPQVTYLRADEDFLDVFGIGLSAGKFFEKGNPVNSGDVLINKCYADMMEVKNPVGMLLRHKGQGWKFRIIGVVKDFFFRPVDEKISPMIIFNKHTHVTSTGYIFLKVNTDNISSVTGVLEETWNRFNPDYPFTYHFFDEDFENMYRGIERTELLIRSFALLAVFISCLGLFGMASFLIGQRTKEIGIRKVLGSSTAGIILILSREFLKCITAANMIALPAAYFLLAKWLQDYAYRIEIDAPLFILPGASTVIIAFLAVGFQSVKAALANPVDALKHE